MEFGNMQKEKTTSWLAIKLGCCASERDVVEDGEVASRAHGEADKRICYDQPQLVPQPCAEPTVPRPSTSHSVSKHVSQWVSSSREYATRASSRASISTLTRPRRSHSRPSISRPTEFRHFDGPEGIQSMLDDAPMPVSRRGSFRPLELSIYMPNGCGHLSPLPDFEDEERWTDSPAEVGIPAEALVRVRDSRTNSMSSSPSTSSYVIQRKAVPSHSRRSSVQSQKSTSTHERHLSGTTMATMATPTLPQLAEEQTSSASSSLEKPTIQRSRTSGTLSPARVLSRLPSPSRNRANTAPSRPNSLRRTRTDVDDAIRELNTIVEERRASAYRSHSQSPALINRPPPSPSHHVPYIAPSMRMHVRSETLCDIGSAFSAPLARKALATRPSTGLATVPRPSNLSLFPPTRSYIGPLTSNPITPPPPATPTTPVSRLGAWLKRSASTITSSSRATTPKTADSFYKCDNTPALPLASRPSTAGSRTVVHSRQDSQESNGTATVTLFSSSYPSSRSSSPVSSVATSSPPRKLRRVPAPLTLIKDKEIAIESALPSSRSTRSIKPPPSPHYGLLRGMEITAKDVGVNGHRMSIMPSPGAVGVAF
ncbi:hypothetical protein NX059_002868 [Plenodomus lindquistii]|nr:hypothetical protein NX059_002868 [Plenodomus lindquistii]